MIDNDKQNNKQNVNINNIHNIHNNNNNNVTVNINSFGKEDLSHITDKDYEKYLTKISQGFIQFIEHIHFSDKMPINYNMCIPQIDSEYIAIYEKNKWNIKNKDRIINKIIGNKISILDKKCYEFEKNGSIDEKFVDLYNDFASNYYNGDDITKKHYIDEISLMIYNNRNKIKDYDKLL